MSNGIKKRLDWIDIAKGYGIILVIFAHLNNWTFNNYIYSFHLPLFFFLSGYVFKSNDNFLDFILKKTKGLIVPYFLLGIPTVIFTSLYNLKGVGGLKYYSLQLLIQKRQFTIWFLACLFILNILFYFVEKYLKKDIYIVVASIVCVIFGLYYYQNGGKELPWNFDVCFTAMPFFAAGFIFKRKSEKIDKIIKSNNYLLYIIVFTVLNLLLTYFNIKLSGSTLEMYFNVYGKPLLTYPAAFFGIFAVILISKKFEFKLIKYVGRNSLLYFAWHQAIFMPIVDDIFIIFTLDKFLETPIIGNIIIISKLIVILILISLCKEIIQRTVFGKYLVR